MDEQDVNECPQYFAYDPLPDRHIRLLQIQPHAESQPNAKSMNETIEICLYTVDLDDPDLRYDALSYTWGPPSTELKEAAARDIFTSVPRCYPIFCSGQIVRVTKSLKDALQYLRFYESGRVKEIAERDFPKMLGRKKQALIWIDGICINQDDIDERSKQVALMGELYTKANLVLGWLGPDDKYTRMGVRVAHEVEDIMYQLHADEDVYKTPSVHQVQDERFWKSLGREEFTREEWYAWIKVATREWFLRTWIMQEIALSTGKIVALCGSTAFDLSRFMGSISFIKATGWLAKIAVTLTDDQDFNKTIHEIMVNHPLMYMFSIWMRQKRGKASLFHLLHRFTFSGTSCMDPRDRVYGTMGMAREFQTDGRIDFDVDYRKPVGVLYTEATLRCIARNMNLDVLHCAERSEAPGYNALWRLPSWCPDYHASEEHDALDLQPGGENGIDVPKLFFASRGSSCQVRGSAPDGTLCLRGICCDIVVGLRASPRTSLHPFDLAGLAASLELLEDVTLESHESKVDLLWRAIVHDAFDPEHGISPPPAARTTMHQFKLGWMFEVIAWVLEASTPGAPYSIELTELVGSIIPHVARLRQEDSSTDELFPDFCFIFQALILNREALTHGPFLYETGNPYDQQVMRLFTNIQSRWLHKRMFRTADGRLGGTWKTVDIGDEVWLLAGGGVPYVLRPLPDGTHRFIGEAYVSGMMTGELWPEHETELVDLTLV